MAFFRSFFAGIDDAAAPADGHVPARVHIVEEFPENKGIVADIHVAVIEKNQVKRQKDIGIQQAFGKIASGKPRRFLNLQDENPVAPARITFQNAKRQDAFTAGLNAGQERIFGKFLRAGKRKQGDFGGALR